MRADMIELIGIALRRIREAKKLTQESFADSIGMHRTYYSAVERGERNITASTLIKIADGLKIRPSQIWAFAEQMK